MRAETRRSFKSAPLRRIDPSCVCNAPEIDPIAAPERSDRLSLVSYLHALGRMGQIESHGHGKDETARSTTTYP
jgi:hypothetical protein